MIIPTIKGIRLQLSNLVPVVKDARVDKFLQRVHYFIDAKLGHYERNQLCQMATLMDPRFKKKGFWRTNGEEEAKALVQNLLVEEMKKFRAAAACQHEVMVKLWNIDLENCKINDYVLQFLQRTSQPELPVSAPSTSSSSLSCNLAKAPNTSTSHKKENDLFSFLDEPEKTGSKEKQPNTVVADAIVILNSYLGIKPLDKESNPLEFWFNEGKIYQFLFKIVCKIFCIPGSSVPVECMFSSAGYTVSSRRARLLSSTIQMLTFLNLNHKLIEENFMV